MNAPRVYDVVIVSDLRLYGGSTRSSVQEAVALADAGYRVALVPVPVHGKRSLKPVQAEVRALADTGAVDLVRPGVPIDCGLVLVRQPATLRSLPPAPLRVRADQALVVANSMPSAFTRTGMRYEVPTVTDHARACFGPSVRWAPISPLVRELLLASDPDVPLWSDDWVNVIDADAWRHDRRATRERPVIGRHSRDHRYKWPETAELTASAYPADDRIRIVTMGGASVPRAQLGGLPDTWTDLPQDHLPVRDFLLGIDLFVYFHHPDWYEAFGRSTLEALATGAPALLPRSFDALFGDAATYVDPHGVLDEVLRLAADPPAYREASQRALAAVADRFSYRLHVERVRDVVGPPPARDRRDARTARQAVATSRRYVDAAAVHVPGAAPALLVSADASRASAVRLDDAATAHGWEHRVLVAVDGEHDEPLASRPASETVLSPRHRRDVSGSRGVGDEGGVRSAGDLLARVVGLVEELDLAGLVLDAPDPAALAAQLGAALPPSPAASPGDRGDDGSDRGPATSLATRLGCPVVLCSPSREPGARPGWTRAVARTRLGIAADRFAVLVDADLAPSVREEVTASLTASAAALGREATFTRLAPGSTTTAIGSTDAAADASTEAALAPAAALVAFDAAVVTGASWDHGLLEVGVPTAVVQADAGEVVQADAGEVVQADAGTVEARSTTGDGGVVAAVRAGAVLSVDAAGDGGAERRAAVLAKLLDPGERRRLVSAGAEYRRGTPHAIDPGPRTGTDPPTTSGVAVHRDHQELSEPTSQRDDDGLVSGTYLAPDDQHQADAVGLVVLGASDDQWRRLCEHVAHEQAVLLGFRPVFLTDRHDLSPLRRHGFAGESILSRVEWSVLATRCTYDDYLRRHLHRFERQFGLRRLLVAREPTEVPRGALML